MSNNKQNPETTTLSDDALDSIEGGRFVADRVYSSLNKQRGGAQTLDLAKRNSLSTGLET